MTLFFRRHWLACVFALLVGALSVAPHLLAVRAIGNDYRGMPFMYLDDEDIYLGRIHEIIDGHWPVGSPMFHEYKNTPTLMLPLAESAYALASRITGLSLVSVFVVSWFVFPALLFLLVYAFCRRLLTKDGQESLTVNLEAVVGGLLVTLGYDLFYDVQRTLHVLRGTDQGVWLSIWTRPVNPISGALTLFAYLTMVWEIVKRKRTWLIVPTAFLLCLMVSYVFSWAIAVSISVILFIAYLFRKDWSVVKRLGLMLFAGVGGSIAYLLSQSPVIGQNSQASLLRNGLFFTHVPLLNKTLLVAIVLFLVFTALRTWKTKNLRDVLTRDWWLFCAALLIGSLWAFSQQILTGRTIWPYHFVQYTKPLSSIALLVAGFHLLRPSWPRAWRTAMFGLVSVCILTIVVLTSTYRSVLVDFRARQAPMEAFAWLESHAQKDCVVLTKETTENLARLVPAFTHCDVYLSSWTFSGVPAERVRHNFFIQLSLKDLTPETARQYLTEHREVVRETFFSNWTELFHLGDESWIERKIDELIPQYAEFAQKDFHQQLKQYRLDFVLSEQPLTSEEQKRYGVQDETNVGGVWIYASLP